MTVARLRVSGSQPAASFKLAVTGTFKSRVRSRRALPGSRSRRALPGIDSVAQFEPALRLGLLVPPL